MTLFQLIAAGNSAGAGRWVCVAETPLNASTSFSFERKMATWNNVPTVEVPVLILNTNNYLDLNVGVILNSGSMLGSTGVWHLLKDLIVYLSGIVLNIDIFIPPFKPELITHCLQHLMPQQPATFGQKIRKK